MADAALIATVAQRLVQKRRAELAWADVTAAVGGASAGQKAALLEAIKLGNGRILGEQLIALVLTKVKADAETEAAAMLADDALSAAELTRIL